ncbi:MAG: iron hydrogenase small subunit [Spirochaetales bacterium]|nr:iron hydrogenase small subunit [Spirochaetales bacterium]
MVNLTINDIPVQVEKGTTVLAAAESINIKIPRLCYYEFPGMEKINRIASCRVCVVEIEGRRNLAPACATEVTEGMVVKTNSPRAIKARRTMVELLLSDHPQSCLNCEKNNQCDLQQLAADLHIHQIKYEGEKSRSGYDNSSFSLKRDMSKCVMCRRCEVTCNDVQTCNVLSGVGRGFGVVVSTAFHLPQAQTACTFCGQCVSVCPTGALTGVSYVDEVWAAINNPNKTVIVQTAPAVRVGISEEFGMPTGQPVTGKMVAGLKMLGFDKVFDTDFSADLTIWEEATELIERLKAGKNLPILTSCCPGWINFIEHNFPELLNIPSSCKSPQQMFGAIAKSYYAKKIGVDPKDLIVVSVMPCLAKKYEAHRSEFIKDNVPDIDYVLTTRELASMFREAGVDLRHVSDAQYDDPLGESTGAAVIFGVTGGVLEAALRTAYEWVTNKELKDVVFNDVRGLDGIKEATVDLAGTKLNVAVASGLGNARKLLNKVKSGEANYHAIEIMACPGGCINGGGQPYKHGDTEALTRRMEGLYEEDRNLPKRKSHENESIKKLYAEFLEKPGSHIAHDLLHTHYFEK